MPEATYIPLDGSSNRSCGWWSSLTGLEKVLIFLSLILAIFVFALTIALVSCKGEGPAEPTTVSPLTSTTTITTEKPTKPTEITTTPKPPVVTTNSTAPPPPLAVTTASPPPSTPQNNAE